MKWTSFIHLFTTHSSFKIHSSVKMNLLSPFGFLLLLSIGFVVILTSDNVSAAPPTKGPSKDDANPLDDPEFELLMNILAGDETTAPIDEGTRNTDTNLMTRAGKEEQLSSMLNKIYKELPGLIKQLVPPVATALAKLVASIRELLSKLTGGATDGKPRK